MATNKRLIKSNDDAAPTVPASFNTVTYTGNGTKPAGPVLNFGFQPDLVWIKQRNAVRTHRLSDSLRGGYSTLSSDTTDAEVLSATDVRVNFDYSSTSARVETASAGWNASGETYVAWGWKAGGAAVTNTDGTITSQVSANTEAGFSIVSYTGDGLTSATIGHGLGDKPAMVITKMRSQNGGSSSTSQWMIYHKGLTGNTSGDNPYSLYFQTDAELDLTAFGSYDNITENVIPVTRQSVSTAHNNNNLSTYIAYCFAEVAGFSKFGSYTGTGASGKSVTTDFEPAFILVKRTDNISAWRMIDNKRFSGGNKSSLSSQTSAAEQVGYIDIDFNATNFTINSTNVDFNASGGTYIYMAFANQF